MTNKVQIAVQKKSADHYWIWGLKVPPTEIGMNNFVGPDFGENESGYRKGDLICRLKELGLTESAAHILIDMADERGIVP